MKNLDHKISKMIYDRTHGSPVLTLLAKFGATYVIAFIVAAAVWIEPRVLIPVFIAWAITTIVQLIVQRKRPFECAIYEAKVKLFCKTPSFPSSHATIAFAAAMQVYLYDMHGLHNGFTVWFFLAAIWIAVSRVAVGVHYVSDVVAGALIGSLVPWLFVLLLYLSCSFTPYCL